MRHLLNPLDFSVEEIDQLLDLASDIEANPAKYAHVCDGKKIATLFYEPSTRTRLSFEAAMLNLGGELRGTGSWLCFCRFKLCFQGRECGRYHPRYLLLRRYLRDAPPEGRCADGCFPALFHPGYQCRRRRSPASDADLDRSDDDPFFKRTPEQFNSRPVRRFEIRTHGSFLNQCAVPLHRHPFRPHFPAGTARPGLYH